MTNPAPSVDGVLVQWGERLFYPPSRIVKVMPQARLDAMTRRKAAVVRQRIAATVTRRAPQVMVKVTGGGRGMAAIAAHFRYISRNGRLPVQDERGEVRYGKESLHDLADRWRYGGSFIDEVGHRREAFNIMLSMPSGTDAQIVRKAAREFAHSELSGHRYVMVLHQHQANPHVHLSVRAESMTGERLNPRKADLHRWRETFAEKLRAWGVEAEATRQATRVANRTAEPLWRLKAREEGRFTADHRPRQSGDLYTRSRNGVLEVWLRIMRALALSGDPQDKALAQNIARFVRESPFAKERGRGRSGPEPSRATPDRPPRAPQPTMTRDRAGPEIER